GIDTNIIKRNPANYGITPEDLSTWKAIIEDASRRSIRNMSVYRAKNKLPHISYGNRKGINALRFMIGEIHPKKRQFLSGIETGDKYKLLTAGPDSELAKEVLAPAA